MKSRFKTCYLALLAITLLMWSSCANYVTKATDTSALQPNAATPYQDTDVAHQLLLISDIALNRDPLDKDAIKMLEKQLTIAGKNSTLLFLGDNIRSFDPSNKKKADQKQPITALFPILKTHKGAIHFLPGEIEWKNHSQPGLKAIENWLQDELPKDDEFFVDDGCPGPESREISDKLVLIAFDSQWLLQDWDGHKTYNSNCDIRDKEWFMLQLVDEINNYARTHNIILAMHHPVMSKGRHGGYASLKDHLFPIRKGGKIVPVPLPVIGSIITFFDQRIGSRQDLANPAYLEYSDFIDDLRRDYPGMIVVSGHDHNLQYLENKGQHYIVSGSFKQNCPAKLDDEAQFVSGENGLAKLIVLKDGSVWLEFIKIDNAILYRKQIKEALPTVEELMPDTFLKYEKLQDSAVAKVAADNLTKKYSTFWWGKLYTDEYHRMLKVPVLDLEREKGGLKAFQRGGGFQTINIRLRDSLGHLYHIRSLRKSADKLLPFPFNKTFATDIARKQLTAGNPYGAFVLGPMMDAIDLYHSNPKMVYVPKQPNLGRFNNVGNQIYLFEERPDEDWSTLDSYGNSENIVSHSSMREEIFKDTDHYSDQERTLRSRLFDMLIGDWDRHDDQWRWATTEKDGKTFYEVIPRDRDQAFARYGGVIPNLIRTTFPFARSTQTFSDEISDGDIKWMNRQARNFDRLHLNKLSWEDWEKQVEFIQTELSDEAIENSMKLLPPEVLEGNMDEFLVKAIKSRRDNLKHYARAHYVNLYKKVDVVGTHDENIFVVERNDDHTTRVRVYEKEGDDDKEIIHYDRIFENEITEEIRCYGLDGDDSFFVTGNVKKGPLIRYIGGNGKDTYSDRSKVSGLKKKNKIYDYEKGEFFIRSKETDLKLSGQYDFNHYNYKDHPYNYTFAYPLLGINPDDGFLFSANLSAHFFGFKKYQQHLLSASHAFGSNSYSFDYRGEYFHAFGKSDITLDITLQEPRFVSNFFGLGNMTSKLTDDIEFYRYRSSRLFIHPAYRRIMSDEKTELFVGPTYESIKIEQNNERFLSGDGAPVHSSVFDRQRFVGLKGGFAYSTVDNPWFPVRGITYNLSGDFTRQLEGAEQENLRFQSEFTWYQPLDNQSKVLLATRVGGAHTFGDFYFFQANQIGGNDNLRGFRAQRFSGRSSFYHNTDIRYAFMKARVAGVPFSLGIMGGFDYGRVWQDNETSDKWHTGYGGGVWIAPINYFVLTAGIFTSEEETRFQFRFGFHF